MDFLNSREDDTGHRGGAWKVAYADFVTALMALFIVLWLISSGRSKAVAVATGPTKPERLAAQNPDALLESFADLERGLEAILS